MSSGRSGRPSSAGSRHGGRIAVLDHAVQVLAGGPESEQPTAAAVDQDPAQEGAASTVAQPLWHHLPIDGPTAEKEVASKLLQFQKMQQVIASLSDGERAIVKAAETEAQRLVRTLVRLVVESERRQTITAEVDSFLKNMQPVNNDIVVLYDGKIAGEPITNPHVRVPPFKQERVKKAFQCILEALQTDSIPMNTVFVISDAGQLGNKSQYMNSLQLGENKIPRQCKELFVAWNESEMQSRLQKFRATKALQQLETVYIVRSTNAQEP